MSPGQSQQPAMEFPLEPQRHGVAAVTGNRRPGPVGGQLKLLGQALQRFGPECDLAGDRALRISLAAKHVLLPESVVSILDGQRRQLGRRTLAARGVGAGQVAGQRRQRPTVAGNVMEDQQQDVLALA